MDLSYTEPLQSSGEFAKGICMYCRTATFSVNVSCLPRMSRVLRLLINAYGVMDFHNISVGECLSDANAVSSRT